MSTRDLDRLIPRVIGHRSDGRVIREIMGGKSGGGTATYEPTPPVHLASNGRQAAAVTHTPATGISRQNPELVGGCSTYG